MERSMLALPPDVVRWVGRNGEDGDCAIAAIALACGTTYEETLAAALLCREDAIHGLNWKDMKALVKRLGLSCSLHRKYDLDEDTGVLDCRHGRKEHVVYLWEGRIIEPRLDRRSLWLDPKAFLEHEGWTAGMLLKIRK